MSEKNPLDQNWYEYISHKVNRTYLAVLHFLSVTKAPLVEVGSGALLARGYYRKNYWWDIDLLFPDVASLETFINDINDANFFRIEHVDQEIQETPELYSFHTLWSYNSGEGKSSGWVNVDLIVRRDFDWYCFHRRALEKYGKFSQEIELDGETFFINLFMAHPWGIFVEKVFSPRLMRELTTENVLSYDGRDIFTILERDGTTPDFTSFILEVLNNRWVDAVQFRSRFMQIINHRDWLGYGYVRLPKAFLKSLQSI